MCSIFIAVLDLDPQGVELQVGVERPPIVGSEGQLRQL